MKWEDIRILKKNYNWNYFHFRWKGAQKIHRTYNLDMSCHFWRVRNSLWPGTQLVRNDNKTFSQLTEDQHKLNIKIKHQPSSKLLPHPTIFELHQSSHSHLFNIKLRYHITMYLIIYTRRRGEDSQMSMIRDLSLEAKGRELLEIKEQHVNT